MNGFDFIIQLIWLLMVVVGSVLIIVGFVLIIEMIASLYYVKSYLNDLIKMDEEEGRIVEHEDDKLIEAIKLVRRDRIIKGLLGVIFIVGGFIALFM